MLEVDKTWLTHLSKVIDKGLEVRVRGLESKELMAHQSIVNMEDPIISIAQRELGYKFMAQEALNILTGQNTVHMIKDKSERISQFSDDGYFFNGHYGPKFVDQITYIVDALVEDMHTRQAVMSIWRPNPRPSKDIPCTISLQFLVRANRIYCFLNMRSSDIWLGYPYDIFNMSCAAVFVSLLYGLRTGNKFRLGQLVFNTSNLHLYNTDLVKAQELCELKLPENDDLETKGVLDIDKWNHPLEFINWLWGKAKDGNFNDEVIIKPDGKNN
tara:strand:- start:20606 stop:21418 length:813 start_codon:yes stop_codon:yes gene_type:complete